METEAKNTEQRTPVKIYKKKCFIVQFFEKIKLKNRAREQEGREK